MQSLSISQIGQSSKPAITGYLYIKRNLFWSERYIRMGDGKLSYYEEKADTVPKGVLILKDAEIIERYHGKPEVIQIKTKNSNIPQILIKIEQPNFRTKFIRCLHQNTKTDDKRNTKQLKDLSFQDLQQLQNDYPPLPALYKNYFDQKFIIQQTQGSQIVFSEKSEDRSKNQESKSSVSRFDAFVAGAICGGLLLFDWMTALIGVTLLLILTIHYIYTKRKQSKASDNFLLRKQSLLNVELDDIFNLLQTFRGSIYIKQNVKFIINEQLFFQEGMRYFLVEKDINKLRYMWEFIPSQEKTLVSVIFDSDNPEISLTIFSHLALRIRNLPKDKSISKNKSTITGVSGLSYSRSKSAVPLIQNTLKEVDDQYQPLNKDRSSNFLPSVEQMTSLYPKTPKALLQECAASRKIFMDTINMQYDKTEEKNNCQMSVREMPGGLLITKGTTKLKGNLDQIVKYVRDLSKRGEYDGMFNSGKLLEQFEISGVLHQKFNGMFPVSARDFVLLLSVQNIENGIMIHGKSTKYIQYPPDSKTVRGEVLSAGFLLKTVGDLIEVTYLTYSDPSGSLPDMIKKKAGAMQSGVILKLREILLKKFKQ